MMGFFRVTIRCGEDLFRSSVSFDWELMTPTSQEHRLQLEVLIQWWDGTGWKTPPKVGLKMVETPAV